MENALLKYIKAQNFNNPRTLIGGLMLLIIFYASIDNFLNNYISKDTIRVIIYILIWGIWIIIWFIEKERWPHNEKGKVGIIIGIGTENDKQKNRIKNDLKKRIEELVNRNKLDDYITIILISPQKTDRFLKIIENYAKYRSSCISSGIDNLYHSGSALKKWNYLLRKTKGHFFLWGNIKERQDKENSYFIELDSIVTHRPLDKMRQSIIKKEILNVWIKKISFREQFEFKGFLLSADLIYIAVKYITGIAAFFSGDPFLAIKLHQDLDKDLNVFDPLPPNLNSVKNKLKELMCEEYLDISHVHHIKRDYPKAKELLNKALNIKSDFYRVYLLKSIYDFFDGNPNDALSSVKKAKKYSKNDGTWRYNEAFLYMYLEKWEDAIKAYRKIYETSYPSENITQKEVIEFNISYYKSNPKFLQSLYILGYIKLRKENNYPESFQYFEEFIEKAEKIKKYNYLLIRAKSYMHELKERMNL